MCGGIRILTFLAENHILKKQVNYRYGGQDKETKEIYTAAKRTIDLCASGDYVWDGVKRDRLVWIGDMHPEMLALTTLYGAMLKCGATTFFEDFDITWVEKSCRIDRYPKENERDIHGDFGAFCYKGFRHSLCHGWAAGVLAFIKEEIGE